MRRLAISFAPRALRDLADIRAWLLKEAGPVVAGRTIGKLSSRIRSLRSWPNIGVSHAAFGEGVRFVPVGSYVLYYRPDEERIILLRVLHAAQDRDVLMSGDDANDVD